MKKYGGFDEKDRFVIEDPYTPEPWLHYLIRVGQPGTDTFCSGVSYSGGGFDVKGTHENTFVDTQLHLNDEDNNGRYVYIHDRDSDDLFTTSWQPMRHEEQSLKTTLDFGQMIFESSYKGIETVQTMFVPPEFDGWIQNIKIRNTRDRECRLSIYPYVPMHMGDALERLLAGDNDGFFGGASFDRDLNAIVFRRHHGTAVHDDPDRINGMLGNVAAFYSTLNKETTPYETNAEGFLGDRFHTLGNPASILKGELSCRDTPYLRRSCGVFRNDIELAPGEELEFAVALVAGSTEDYYLNNKSELRKCIALIRDGEKRKDMADEVLDWWKRAMDRLTVSSPDNRINRGFKWLQYQCEIVYILNRMKSRYHTGYEYGWGFRDILQDILYTLPYRAEGMGEVLKNISTQMFSSGRAYHNFFIDQPGNKSIEASDDPLWFINAVVKYCRETGNFSFLEEISDYAEVREGEGPCEGSILEHCTKALERVWTDRSPRGLPYMKDCDWNDDLNELRINGKPNDTMESVMVAQQLYLALIQMAELLEAAAPGDEKIGLYRDRAVTLKQDIRKHCMDREGYFLRATSVDPHGEDLGSSSNERAKIFLEPQTFGINCAVAEEEEADTILNAVQTYLDSEFGAMLCYPVFTDLSDHNILPRKTWNIEKEPPAMKENGGIFMHLNAWLVQSYCMAGRGNDAVAHYQKNIPENMSADQDRYMSEPYVYPEYVRGKGIDSFGRGGHTWLTGTAPTMHMALTEYIFGLRPVFEGLQVDPCVASDWRKFSVRRQFRGACYDIHVSNPEGVQKGVKEIRVDDKPLKGTVLPPFSDGQTHRVEVIMG